MNHYQPEVLISSEEIELRITDLAKAISKDYEDKELVFLCVLKGAFIFCSDLMKKVSLPVSVEFISLSSYGDGMKSSGQITTDMDITGNVAGKDVLIVEDIVDSGLTINFLKSKLREKGAESIKVASLLHKPGKQKFATDIDYLAFEIEDKFVIGYGLDYAGRYREIPYIGVLNAGQ